MSNDIINKSLMTPMEYRLFMGLKPSASDTLKKNRVMADVMKECLNIPLEVRTPTGEVVIISAEQRLIMSKLAYDIEHPEKTDLVMWSKVKGEFKEKAEVKVQNAGDYFGDIVINAAVEEIDIGK